MSDQTEELPGLDLARLRERLEAEQPGLTRGPLSGQLIQGGRSNLTYVITDGTDNWVVRRPPLGHVLATAHDMSREHRVMSALAGTSVPVPRTYLLCQDEDVIGAPFYVMEHVPGTVYRSPEQTGALTREQKAEVSERMMDVLARLHTTSVGPAPPASPRRSCAARPAGSRSPVLRWPAPRWPGPRCGPLRRGGCARG